jgi:hypothetical protein
MKTIARHFAFLAFAAVTTSAMAHAKLQNSTPANATTVSSPSELRLQYNEAVEAAVSTVKVFGPGNAEVATDKVAASKDDPKALVLPLPALSSGDYRADWTTAGHDGHKTKGQVRFTVK